MYSHLADFLIIATVYFAATLECNYCSVHTYTLLQYTYICSYMYNKDLECKY